MISDPAYNLRQIVALSNLEHDFLSMHNVIQFVEIAFSVIDWEGTGTCSARRCSLKRGMNG